MKSNKNFTIEFIEKGECFGDRELAEIYGGASCFINVQCGCKSDKQHSNTDSNYKDPVDSTNGKRKLFKKCETKGFCFIVCIE